MDYKYLLLFYIVFLSGLNRLRASFNVYMSMSLAGEKERVNNYKWVIEYIKVSIFRSLFETKQSGDLLSHLYFSLTSNVFVADDGAERAGGRG